VAEGKSGIFCSGDRLFFVLLSMPSINSELENYNSSYIYQSFTFIFFQCCVIISKNSVLCDERIKFKEVADKRNKK
jgi:hypothetical protein